MRAAAWLGVIAGVVGCLILIGWIADIAVLKSLLPQQVQSKANTGLGVALLGIALALKGGPLADEKVAIRSANCAAVFVVVMAALTGLEYLFQIDLGIDQLLFREPATAVDTVYLGRMALPTAINLSLLGWAMRLLNRTDAPGYIGWIVALPSLISGLAFIAYLYDVPGLASFGPFTPIAAPTATALLLLCIGVWLSLRPEAKSRRDFRTMGLGAALGLLLLLAGGMARHTQSLIRNAHAVAHTHEVIGKIGETLSAMQDIETGMRGYVLTGNPTFLEPYESARGQIRVDIAELKSLISDNPGQEARRTSMEAGINAELEFAEGVVELRRKGDFAVASTQIATGQGKRLMDGVRAQAAQMKAEEEALLTRRERNSQAATAKAYFTLGVGLLGSFSLLGVIFNLLRREIEQRARTELALRRSEESLAVTLHSIGDGMLACDTDGRITRMNRVAEELTGWTSADAMGRPIAEVFRIINEQSRAPGVIPVDDVLATGEIQGLANHTILIARDLKERSIADSAAPIRDHDGKILGVVLVFRDVSEERAAELKLAAAREEFDRFFALSLDFLCISSADGYFKRVSPAVTDILGWTPAEFLATPYLDFVHPDDLAATTAEVERQVKRGEKVLQFENRYRHRDGSWRVLSWRSVPQPGGLMYATARDVTESSRTAEKIRELNAELQQHTQQLEAANRELESFSYSVSHDLRAPLRHVMGFVELLSREASATLSEKGKRHLATIAQAAKDMGQLIDDLLSFSRMARTEMRENLIEPEQLVAEVRRGMGLPLEGRNVHWTIQSLPRVSGDYALLKQVFANLLSNAVKYTRGRDLALIEVGTSGREDGRVIFFVRDNGAGFEMAYAHKLFGVFSRLHRSDEFEGTGIGLALVRRIISRHGGRTWAEGKVGEGATFYFTLSPALSNSVLPSK